MAPRIKRHADPTEVRRWAVGLSDEQRRHYGIEGLEVSNRGRFHSKIIAAYNKAHREQGLRYVPVPRNVPPTPEELEYHDKPDDEVVNGGEVYRQPRQEPRKQDRLKQEEAAVPPTPLPISQPKAQPAAAAVPPAVMEMLRSGQNVVVVYVPVEMAAAV